MHSYSLKTLVLLLLILLAAIPADSFAQYDVLYSWDFNISGNSEGWQPTHSLSLFLVLNGTLRTTISGSDPYMFGPAGLSIDAARYGFIIVRMRVTHDSNAEFFWTTTESPNFKAGFEFGFRIIPDGEFHVYEVPVKKSNNWRGTITRLRLDPGEGSSQAVAEHAVVEIDYIRVVHIGPRLELISFAPGSEVMTPADTAKLSLIVKNSGDETVVNGRTRLELASGLNLAEGDADRSIPPVAPDSTARVEWKITARDTGSYLARITVDQNGDELFADSCLVRVIPALPEFPPDVPSTAQVWSPFGDHWLLENNLLRLAFVKGIAGYGPIIIYHAENNSWQQVAVIQPPGEFAYQSDAGVTKKPDVRPDDVLVQSGNDSIAIVLAKEYADVDGVTWHFRYRYTLSRQQPDRIGFCYQASVDNERKLLNFSGPIVRVGEGAFRAEKEQALFPGLEWLIDDEESSSPLDVHPPQNERYIPHPYKVTIPLMSVANRNLVIGLTWNPLQRWYGDFRYPSPLFASPNTWDSQDNHLLGLLAPSVPTWRDENAGLATKTVVLQPDSSMKICASLFLLPNEGYLPEIKWWLRENGLPELPPKPRTYLQDIALNCESYMDVLWVPAQQGWHMALPDPWGPIADHGTANKVWLGSLFYPDADRAHQWRAQMRQLGKKFIDSHNPGGLGWDFSFRYGELDQAWGPLVNNSAHQAHNQNEDGGWLFAGDPTLKNKGETSLGSCSIKAYILLRAARITGDPYCLQRGLAALEFMKQFRVPRGAQVWEVPLHAPDILAAAQAVLAYVEGYRVTGRQDLLDEAVRWAYAGLPFTYLWSAHDRPIMRYGSIPVFGATWYTGAWFGKLVQWNGLDYAYALLKLWEYDRSQDWQHIAEGLTICGMQQQRTADTAYPENKGMYPDAYSEMLGDEAYHWDLAPGGIMKNVLKLSGLDPDVYTRILNTPEGKIHVNSGMDFSADISANTLRIRPRPLFPDSIFFVLIPVQKPSQISFAGRVLPEVADVDSVRMGWAYSIYGNVIVKLFVADSSSELEVSDINRLPLSGEPDWEFNIDNYSEGWVPNFDVIDLAISRGLLQAKSNGSDPWFISRLLDVNASDYDSLLVRMRTDKGSGAQLFWQTKSDPNYSEPQSSRFALKADGYFHTYSVPLSDNRLWQGKVIQLRFDPTNQANAEFAIDYIRLVPATGTLVRQEPSAPVASFRLLPNYPNPFQSSTRIGYILQRPGKVKLTIYNILGRKVREIVGSANPATTGSFLWDRRDSQGRVVPAGVYLYRMTVEDGNGTNHSNIRKLVLLPISP